MASASLPHTNLPRVLIIGGGFGGIALAKALRKTPFQVVMFDRNNYHTFQPLLYQVATGGLEPDSIAFPLRKVFTKQDNFIFRMAEVEEIDPDKKVVHTSIGLVSYDYLVIATGSRTNFFGNEEIESHAVGMKNIPESLDLRSLMLQNFEQALQHPDMEVRDILMKFVVVGGGPTGVETSGALAELKRHVLPCDYPELDMRQMEIHLIEAGTQLLNGMSDGSSQDAKAALEKLGVHVWLNTQVTEYDGKVLRTNKDQAFDTSTVIWAAGVTGSLIPGLAPETTERGRLVVDEYNQVQGHHDIYALGDVALMKTEEFPFGHPQVAPGAMQMGENLAKNLISLHHGDGETVQAFTYYDKGSMATIGRNKAVVDWKNLHLKGRPAWLMWMFVHLLFLIGFRNKLVVFVNWVWSYLTYDKGTRVIIRPYRKRPKPVKELG